ncbi:MAG TPA: ATP-binding protein [Candidatus Thermoplasmatota archaeon]|nr:ATP-binding protein [Candidatus Thermoplasmatota archaeon]
MSTGLDARLLQSLLDNSSDGLFLVAPDGSVRSWNWGAEQTFGFTAEEVGHASIYASIVPKDRAADIANAIHETLETGSAVLESEAVRKDGMRLQAMYLLKPVQTTGGERLIGVLVRDVSPEKRLEQQLFQQIWSLTEVQAFLQGVLDSSSDYTIAATDLNGRIVAWSAGGVIHFGRDAAAATGRPVTEVLFAPEEHPERIQAALEAAGRGHFEEEFESMDVSGRRFPTRMSVGLLKDQLGEPKGYVFIVKDVTDEKRAAEAIRRKTAFVTLLQNVAVAANEARSIDEAMQRAVDEVCAATGWPVGHVYIRSGEWSSGLSPSKIWHVDDADRFDTFRRITDATSFSPGVGLPGRVLSSGTPHWISDVTKDTNFPRSRIASDIGVRAAFAFPVLVDKEIVAVLEFFADRILDPDAQVLEVMGHVGTQLGRVVERARADEEHRRGMDRILEVEELKEVNKFKEQFIRTISHELNTPITPIKLQLHMLQKELGPLADTQRKAVEVVSRNVERLELLVQDMLDVTRIQSGQLKIARQPTKLYPLVHDALELFMESAKQAGVRLETPKGNGLEVDVDPRRIVQVLVNLVSNALKFTPPGGHVGVEVRNDPNQVMVRVADTGNGMTSDQIARLFRPFSQVHDTQRLLRPGTGLGLYICKNLVEQHGGRIGCESAGPGQGTTFWFTLPVREKIIMKEPALAASAEIAVARSAG